MVLKLFMVFGSPPVNAVLMAAKALNLELELREINFEKKEYLSESFRQLNPAHTVPTLDDDGYVVWDSHAILCYVAEKYDESGIWYPKELERRTRINQILNFDCGTVFRHFSDAVRPLFYDGVKSIEPARLEKLEEVYEILERILEKSQFMTGDSVTIGDISVLSTVTMAELVLPIGSQRFPKLDAWLRQMKDKEFYQAGVKGIFYMKKGLDVVTSQ